MVYCTCKQEKRFPARGGETEYRKEKYAMFEMKWVNGHIEVYQDGVFCFSADNRAEAERELAGDAA